MILSPYHNPPYRTPTPKTSTSLPARSPKRKRSGGTHTPPLQLKTAGQSQNEDPTGVNSPRMQVMEKMKDLNIQPPTIRPPALQAGKRNAGPRKRLKRNSPLVVTSSMSELSIAETPQQTRHLVSTAEESGTCDEIKETPDRRGWVQVSSPPPPGLPKEFEAVQESPGTIRVASRLSSPPPSTPVQMDTLNITASDSAGRPVSPLPLRKDLSSDQAALTWQEDEITGHDIDPGSDDDGEGINGIGFRPTPAIAYARRQRRKQQVNEWKAREAREARQKRFERRRGAGLDGPLTGYEVEDGMKRAVRFAGVG